MFETSGRTSVPNSKLSTPPPGVFRNMASDLLRLSIIEDDNDVLVETVANQIEKEIKDLPVNRGSYNTRVNADIASKECSERMLSLLSQISNKPRSHIPNVLITNMVSSLVTNNPSSLQIALAVFLRERHLINTFYKYGVTCSYDEALRFRGSAASAASQDVSLRGISNTSKGFIQAVVDNFDTNISSPNGLRSTHTLALLLVQPNDTNEVMDTTIPDFHRVS